MRKISIVALIGVITIMTMGCGSKAEDNPDTEGVTFESVEQEAVVEAAEALKTPVVKDGVTRTGEDAIEVVFEWDAVDGAEGYEIHQENKFCEEEEYRKPESEIAADTTETTYIAYAQDDFDFKIRVRAYRGSGDKKEYSQWSEYAYGSSYDKEGSSGKTGPATEKEADELFAKAINGEIPVYGSFEGEEFSFYITDLPNDPEDWECYSVGEKVDLDNDGEKELILNGPYGGKYLDARDGAVYQLSEGEGTTGQICYADYNGNTYICHVDNSHAGREIFMMDQYNGYGAIVESTSLTAEYWDYVDFNEEAAQCHFGGEEIPVERYLELRKEIFNY